MLNVFIIFPNPVSRCSTTRCPAREAPDWNVEVTLTPAGKPVVARDGNLVLRAVRRRRRGSAKAAEAPVRTVSKSHLLSLVAQQQKLLVLTRRRAVAVPAAKEIQPLCLLLDGAGHPAIDSAG